MNRELVISALAALGCHGLLLFGLRLETSPVPHPLADTGIEVSLVAGEPSEPAPPDAAEPPEPPTTEVTPPPTSDPEPVPEPELVPPPTREEMVEPAPKPRPPETPPHAASHPAKPAASAVPHHASAPSSSAVGTPGISTASGPGNSKPGYRSNPRPEYPAEARLQHQEGRVVLSVEVSAEGRPTSVSLNHGSGFPLLDSAALSAVRRWTFEPARIGGVPVAARVEVPVQFDLAR